MNALSGRHVLLAEDEPLIACLAAAILEGAGATVATAANGLDALALITDGAAFDALVTDIRMPRMDGWTLAERAREREAALPVVYVSGYSDVDSRQVDGAIYLRKPYKDRDLVDAVLRVLGEGE